jgi:hypothetical protein
MSNVKKTLAEQHFAALEESYSEVGNLTWSNDDFLESNIKSSRSLYTSESLSARHPRPKELEVYALVSGLTFYKDFTEKLVAVQNKISTVLGESLHYWVAPDNLGVEYCVFKWPTDSWDNAHLDIIQNTLSLIRQPEFQFSIRGIQVNSDGCVIAKGFDESGVLFKIREQLQLDLPFMPKKQSGWAHVPLGRILEPLGTEKFTLLKKTINSMLNQHIAATDINIMRLIHERRWYMEEKTILAEYSLDSLANEVG